MRKLRRLISELIHSRKATNLLALLATFMGVALVIDRPEGVILGLLALPFLISGGALFVWSVWPRRTTLAGNQGSIANQFLKRVTFGGRIIPLFPAIGAALVVLDLAYNLALSSTPGLRTEDIIVLLGAAMFFGYNFVPMRFARERDFVLLFFLCLNVMLVAPLLVARLYYADFDKSVDLYSWIALAPETSAVLTLFGVPNSVGPVAGATAPGLTFTPAHFQIQVTVVITTACSGIYSFGIFAAAFLAFVLTEFQRLTSRTWLLLSMGLLTSYVANVLRMAIIVLIGYYADTPATALQNLLIAHSYAGWLIFLGWISLFWSLLFKFGWRGEEPKSGETPEPTARSRQPNCTICQKPLTPTLAAVRCKCGSYLHSGCISRSGRCPECGSPPSTGTTSSFRAILERKNSPR